MKIQNKLECDGSLSVNGAMTAQYDTALTRPSYYSHRQLCKKKFP